MNIKFKRFMTYSLTNPDKKKFGLAFDDGSLDNFNSSSFVYVVMVDLVLGVGLEGSSMVSSFSTGSDVNSTDMVSKHGS